MAIYLRVRSTGLRTYLQGQMPTIGLQEFPPTHPRVIQPLKALAEPRPKTKVFPNITLQAYCKLA